MHVFYTSFVALSCFLGPVFASPTANTPGALDIRTVHEPLPPSKDPWYTAPPHFRSAAPGTVLRIRRAPGNLTTVLANSSAAYNILYRTTDSNYQPAWAITTLVIPSSHIQQRSKKFTPNLVSLQIPYDTVKLDASPSYSLYTTTNATTNGFPSTLDDLDPILGNGWYLSIPDYEGPLASFALGIQAGHATLDSVHAVLSSNLIPESHTAKYALWGYSGGCIATEWAAELAEQYAPTLNFSGVACGGDVTNATSVFKTLSGSPFTGILASGLVGLTSQSTEAYDYMVSRLHRSGPYNASYLLATRTLDSNQALAAFYMQDIFSYFINGRADVFGSRILTDILNRNMYQGFHGVPRMPFFMYKAIGDELSNVTDTDNVINRYCENGADIWYQRNEVGGHVAEITNGRFRALNWLSSVFEGTYNRTGCLIENVLVNITSVPL